MIRGRPEPRLDKLKRVIVAGSRSYNDYEHFCKVLDKYLKYLGTESLVFISGAAKRGPDEMIIRWCRDKPFECVEIPAQWDALGMRAGYVRNAEMAKLATHALVFWDGVSKGSKNMIDLAMKQTPKVLTHVVKTPPNISESENHG
jgi:YspA, cpYpsA-related SLOG family